MTEHTGGAWRDYPGVEPTVLLIGGFLSSPPMYARLRERLGELRCPTLILHCARDRVCPVSNAWRVAERLGSEDCRVVILTRSRHILTRDREHAAVRREVSDFLARFAGAAFG